jgi:periplasmic protein TonB
MLDQAAIKAVKQWRYQPLVLNGQPVPFILVVTVTFSLR